MTSRYELERALKDAQHENVVRVMQGFRPVSFYLPHRKVDGTTYYHRSSLISLFTPLANAYAGSKIAEFRKKSGYKDVPDGHFDLGEVLAWRARKSADPDNKEPAPYDLNAVLDRAGQSLKEISLRRNLNLNFFIHDFSEGHASWGSVRPHVSPLFNDVVANRLLGPSPKNFVAAFKEMAQQNYRGPDDLRQGSQIYVPEFSMGFQIKSGLRMLASIDRALRQNDNVGDDDRKFWGYIGNAIAPR